MQDGSEPDINSFIAIAIKVWTSFYKLCSWMLKIIIFQTVGEYLFEEVKED